MLACEHSWGMTLAATATVSEWAGRSGARHAMYAGTGTCRVPGGQAHAAFVTCSESTRPSSWMTALPRSTGTVTGVQRAARRSLTLHILGTSPARGTVPPTPRYAKCAASSRIAPVPCSVHAPEWLPQVLAVVLGGRGLWCGGVRAASARGMTGCSRSSSEALAVPRVDGQTRGEAGWTSWRACALGAERRGRGAGGPSDRSGPTRERDCLLCLSCRRGVAAPLPLPSHDYR